jgi:hypothetical protein
MKFAELTNKIFLKMTRKTSKLTIILAIIAALEVGIVCSYLLYWWY